MSFNRRGPDRKPDRDRGDRPYRKPGGDFPPRDRPAGDRPYQPRSGGGDRPYQPRSGGGDRPYQPRSGGDRPYQPRSGGGDRPFQQRPRFDRPPDEGAMSIRLDPRRANALKHLAGEAGVRPGDLVRQWVEERLDAQRTGTPVEAGGPAGGLAADVAALVGRVEALEAALKTTPDAAAPDDAPGDGTESGAADEPVAIEVAASKPARRRASAAPSDRVALHDEMIAVLTERGPMSAADLAVAVAERGRYAPPRSGKAIDAAMISQRVSNPTYRTRFTRAEGRIGLAD